jgi:hypothetical protein
MPWYRLGVHLVGWLVAISAWGARLVVELDTATGPAPAPGPTDVCIVAYAEGPQLTPLARFHLGRFQDETGEIYRERLRSWLDAQRQPTLLAPLEGLSSASTCQECAPQVEVEPKLGSRIACFSTPFRANLVGTSLAIVFVDFTSTVEISRVEWDGRALSVDYDGKKGVPSKLSSLGGSYTRAGAIVHKVDPDLWNGRLQLLPRCPLHEVQVPPVAGRARWSGDVFVPPAAVDPEARVAPAESSCKFASEFDQVRSMWIPIPAIRSGVRQRLKLVAERDGREWVSLQGNGYRGGSHNLLLRMF